MNLIENTTVIISGIALGGGWNELRNVHPEWAVVIWMPDTVLPKLNTGALMTLTLSLLGLGGLRSFEKSKGIARDKMK